MNENGKERVEMREETDMGETEKVEHKRDRDKDYYEREWKREGRNERRDRYGRDRERDRRGHKGDRKERRGGDSDRRERDWEQETPGRNVKDELLTPQVPLKDTPGHAGWEEEEETVIEGKEIGNKRLLVEMLKMNY